jgi:tripartite-type tricarboxylate transporter receptor subunit TctC
MWKFLRVPMGMLLLVMASLALGQGSWPAKPVRLILPNAAGSTPDIVGRAYAEFMAKATGQPWIIENRPGGQSIVGTMAAVKAPADGYTLLLAGTETMALTPLMLKSVPYDPLRDLSLAAVVIDTNGFAIAVPPALPVSNLRELIAMAKAKPGSITYGTSVSLAELLGLWLQKVADVKLVEVRYKDIGVGLQDVITGRIDAIVTSYPSMEPHVKAGKLKVIAVSTAERMPGLAGVQAVSETYPGVAVGGFYFLAGPASLPTEVLERANRETNAVLKNNEFGQRVFQYGWHNVHGPRTLAETAEFARSNYARLRDALQATGFEPK